MAIATIGDVDFAAIGARFRAARINKGWRQKDLAERAGVSRSEVARIESGRFGNVTVKAVLQVGTALGIRIVWKLLSYAGDLDRIVNARHGALHEAVARWLRSIEGWTFAPEVSFSILGERGVIDVLAWHAATRTLLVIELKTGIVDVSELMGGVDRKRRLAVRIAVERGWHARAVSVWVLVAESSTNRRAVANHRTTLRAAFPEDGRRMRAWIRRPDASVRALSFWSSANSQGAKRGLAAVRRVRVARKGAA